MARPKEERLKKIALVKINEPELEQRTAMSEEKLDSLMRSIKTVGLIQPIVVKTVAGDKYEIVVGHRRYLAHKRLELPAILARVVTGSELDQEIRKMHENAEREEISALDEARFIKTLKDRHKMNQAKIAAAMGKSEGYVSQRLAILNAPEVIKAALEDNVISFSVARELAGITDEAELQRLVIMAANNGITPNIARSWRLQWEAGQKEEWKEDNSPEPDPTFDKPFEPGKFGCELCAKPTSVNEMKIVRTCPECFHDIKSA